MEKLSEISLMILDCMLNIRSTSGLENVFETLRITLQIERDDLQKEWDELTEKKIIIKKDYQWIINSSYKDGIREQLVGFLKDRDITPEDITIFIEDYVKKKPSTLSLYIKIMGRITESEHYKYLGFSDYYWEDELESLCTELVKNGIMFRVSSSSRKHYHRHFYLRNQPFDSSEIFKEVALKYLSVEGLTSEEWKILSILLFSSDLSLEYEIIKINTDFTQPELREIVTNLKERGLLEEIYSKITLPQGLKDPLDQYYKTNIYPKFKSDAINKIKQRISRALSNLSIFMYVKMIYELPTGETKSKPFLSKFVRKNEIKEYEPIFTDMRDLNLILDFKDQILILADIVEDIENWLKSSIKESIIFIPARDYYMARNVLRDIFSKCEDYVKIQDPYIGEETFDIFGYIPQNIKINLLTGINTGAGEEHDRIFQRIERLKVERRGKFQIFFIGDPGGSPPFHDRFIISKNRCWQIGTSLKQIGKGKDSTVSEISKREKEELIEPAFDRRWDAKKKELDKENLVKMGHIDWKNCMMIK